MAKKDFQYPAVVLIEAVVMGNGEVIHFGETIGWLNKRQQQMLEKGATKLAKGSEAIVVLNDNVA